MVLRYSSRSLKREVQSVQQESHMPRDARMAKKRKFGVGTRSGRNKERVQGVFWRKEERKRDPDVTRRAVANWGLQHGKKLKESGKRRDGRYSEESRSQVRGGGKALVDVFWNWEEVASDDAALPRGESRRRSASIWYLDSTCLKATNADERSQRRPQETSRNDRRLPEKSLAFAKKGEQRARACVFESGNPSGNEMAVLEEWKGEEEKEADVDEMSPRATAVATMGVTVVLGAASGFFRGRFR